MNLFLFAFSCTPSQSDSHKTCLRCVNTARVSGGFIVLAHQVRVPVFQVLLPCTRDSVPTAAERFSVPAVFPKGAHCSTSSDVCIFDLCSLLLFFFCILGELEEEMENSEMADLPEKQKHQLRHRELFLSRQLESLPATHIRQSTSRPHQLYCAFAFVLFQLFFFLYLRQNTNVEYIKRRKTL